MKTNRKVVLVGTGFVGMSMAYSIVNQGIGVNELVLIDVLKDKLYLRDGEDKITIKLNDKALVEEDVIYFLPLTVTSILKSFSPKISKPSCSGIEFSILS